jgi:hypothetical protein
VAAALASSGALGAAVWTAGHLNPDPSLREAALFVHLVGLVVGFGAVLAVDWVGLLWMLRRRRLADVVDTAGHVNAAIWLGLVALVLSGVVLGPDHTARLTQVKLGLVLAITWNGLFAHVLHRRLAAPASGRPSRLLLAGAGLSTTVSQTGWWGAMAIGFLNH